MLKIFKCPMLRHFFFKKKIIPELFHEYIKVFSHVYPSLPSSLHKEPSPDLLPIERGPSEFNYCCLYFFLNETGSITKDPGKNQFKNE